MIFTSINNSSDPQSGSHWSVGVASTVVAALFFAACNGTGGSGSSECSSTVPCTYGLQCLDGRCVRQTVDAGRGMDAGRRDAGLPNVVRPDAGRPDAGHRDAGQPDRPDGGTLVTVVDSGLGSGCGHDECDGRCQVTVCGNQQCGGCGSGEECRDTWCVPVQTCQPDSCDGRCDTFRNSCGDLQDCGDCGPGHYCSQYGWCQHCEPRSCPANFCGSMDNGCGKTLHCGCDLGERCENSRCVDACDDCSSSERCSNGQCVCRDELHEGVTLGQREHSGSRDDSDEFLNTGHPRPTFHVGTSPVSELRPWIGHSTCPKCAPGTVKKQRLVFSGLVPNARYILSVYPSYVSGTAFYTANIVSGSATIERGRTGEFNGRSGYVGPEARWLIQFIARSRDITFDLGHGLSSGDHFIYIDYYDFTPYERCD